MESSLYVYHACCAFELDPFGGNMATSSLGCLVVPTVRFLAEPHVSMNDNYVELSKDNVMTLT